MHNYEDLIGQLIAGRYRVTSYLKKGGMGVTYRVWDTERAAPAVVKMPLPVEAARNQSFVERFHREIRVMAMLSHPNIVPITDTGDHDGAPFFVMPYLPGGSVWDRRPVDAAGTPLPGDVSRLYDWLPLIASALDYVHGNGAVHRDVKPGNIFFDAYSRPFLGDFGIAKLFDESGEDPTEESLTRTGTAVGTDGYMAPEFFIPQPGQRRATYDGRVDQYALAVMVYEAACGERPFTGDTSHIIAEILTQPPPDLRSRRTGLPASFYRAVHRGLEKDPAARFANCTIFAGAVLQDVVKSPADRGMVRLLCPACRKILKLESSLAGRKGLCPKCRTEMVVGKNLDALWLPAEEAAQTAILTDIRPSPVLPEKISTTDPPVIETFDKSKPANKPVYQGSKKTFRLPVKPKLQINPQQIMNAALSVAVVVALIWLGPRIWEEVKRLFSVQDRKIELGSPIPIDEHRITMQPPLNWRTERLDGFAAFFFQKKGSYLPAIRVRAADAPNAGVLAKSDWQDLVDKSLPGFRNVATPTKTQLGPNWAWIWEMKPEPGTWITGAENKIKTTDVRHVVACSTLINNRKYTVEVFGDNTFDAWKCRKLRDMVTASMKPLDPNERDPERHGLLQSFFKDPNLKEFFLEDIVLNTDLDYPGPPLQGLPADQFSFRLTGYLIPRYTDTYHFSGLRDNGMRMWVNDKKIVDEWTNTEGPFKGIRPVSLKKDERHKIKIEVFDGGGPCKLSVKWQSTKQPLEEIPSSQLRPERPPRR